MTRVRIGFNPAHVLCSPCIVLIVSVLASNLFSPSFAQDLIAPQAPFASPSMDPARRLVQVTTSDNGSGFGTVTFGVHENATYCPDGMLDPDLFEFTLPPFPPPGVYDVRFQDHQPGSECLELGLYVHVQEPFKLDTFKLHITPSGGHPLTVQWPAGLSAEGWSPLTIRDTSTIPLFYVDMLTETTLVVPNAAVTTFYIIGKNWLDTPPDASVTVLAPNGGEFWVPGSTHNITWTSTGLDSVTLEHSTDLGASWNFIATQASTGLYAWLIPNTPSTQCLVRIRSASDSTVVDIGDGAFTIPPVPPPATRRLVGITVYDSYGNARTDTFGVHEDATYCIDGQLDPDLLEQQMPPVPPAGVMDFRFVEHRMASNCLGTGLRVHLQEAYKLDTFRVEFQADDIGYPLHFAWPGGLAELGWDSLVIRDPFNGIFYNVNMLADSTLTVVNPLIGALLIIGSNRLDVPSISVDAPNGGETWYVGETEAISWTSGSIAGVVIDYSTNQGSSWTWVATQPSTGSYNWIVPNTPSPECLVRIRAQEDTTIGDMSHITFTISDEPLHERSASVQSKWNLVSVPVVVGNFAKNALFPTATSGAYSYEGAYVQRDTLYNAGGFWAKFSANQEIPFVGGLLQTDTMSVNPGWNLIGSISDPVAVGTITSVPGGMNTSRFYSYHTSYVESDTIEPGKGYWVKVDMAGSLILGAAGPAAAGNRIKVREVGENPPPPPESEEVVSSGTPEEAYLRQNYPNPFNPSTTIRFALPAPAEVRLAVYNLVGEMVEVLIDGVQPMGDKTIVWDASAFPSGVYYLRLNAGGTVETKKLILLR